MITYYISRSHLGSFIAAASIRPPRSFEAVWGYSRLFLEKGAFDTFSSCRGELRPLEAVFEKAAFDTCSSYRGELRTYEAVFWKAAHDIFSSGGVKLRRWRWWPPRPPEAKNRKSAILLILMVELKVCGWGASARGSGERSEPAAGRPRKEQAPKAPSRIASVK